MVKQGLEISLPYQYSRNKSLVMKQSSPLKCVMALQPVVVHQCVSFVVWSSSLYFLCFCEWEYIIMINEKHKITKESYIWTKDEVERNRNKQLSGVQTVCLHFCTSAIMLYPRCMYPGHFLTIHARHLDCLARFASCHVFTLALHIVAPVKYRLYLT